jgi:hypothetical protein
MGESPMSERETDRVMAILANTNAGRQWLKAATDPFHDFDIPLEGFPDVENGRSVVQCYRRVLTLTRPSGVASTDNWDASIFWTGLDSATPIKTGKYNQEMPTSTDTSPMAPQMLIAGDTQGHFGGTMVVAGPVGHELTPLGYDSTTFNDLLSPFYNNQTALAELPAGRWRLIAGGQEVVNTTAKLYDQGMVTAYRNIDSCERTLMSFNQLPDTRVDALARLHTLMPQSISAVNSLPDSKQWRASDGAYQVFQFRDLEIPTIKTQFGQQLWVPTDPTITFGPTNAWCLNPLILENGGAANYHHETQTQPCGLYFTGLHPLASLTVIQKLYIEYFPDISETALVPLARLSPNYDPAVLEAYAVGCRGMPVGVASKMNASGSFWKGMLGVLKNDLPKLGMMLSFVPDPRVQALGKGLTAIGTTAKLVESGIGQFSKIDAQSLRKQTVSQGAPKKKRPKKSPAAKK